MGGNWNRESGTVSLASPDPWTFGTKRSFTKSETHLRRKVVRGSIEVDDGGISDLGTCIICDKLTQRFGGLFEVPARAELDVEFLREVSAHACRRDKRRVSSDFVCSLLMRFGILKVQRGGTCNLERKQATLTFPRPIF